MTFLKKVGFGILMGGAALGLMGQGASAETLKDALRNAYTHSGLLVQNRALLRAADEDVAQAKALLRPVVSWTASYGYSNSNPLDSNTLSVGISMEWLLYDFGRSKISEAVLKETVLQTRQQLLSIEQDVLLQATEAFYSHRLNTEIVKLRRANVALIQKELRAARDRFEVGEITRTDVSLAEARLASARAALAAAEGNLARSRAEYMRAVGTKPGYLSAPNGGAKIPASLSKAAAMARVQHPAMKQAQHAITMADLGVQAANLATRPSVTLRGSITKTDVEGTGPSRSVSLTAGGIIYNGGKLASAKRKAIAQLEAAHANLHITRHAIDQAVAYAYAGLEVSQASRRASNSQVKAASVAFNGIKEETRLGARTTLDLLNAEQELLDARASRIEAQINEQLASFSILAATGQLTANHLKLGVKTYDPVAYYNLVKSAPAAVSKQGKALDRVLKSISRD